MRRERSQSSDRGRPYVPRWDNPTGQLPGTGIPSGSDSGLHGTSRRRDSSVPERSRLRTSESGASAGESRPSLFDGLSSGFSAFGAVRNMGASEGASGTSTGGVSSGDNAQTLTAMANAAIVSQLQERARASLVGSAVGAEVFHIGSPSDQQGSDFQSVRSRSTQQSLPTHPSTSPVSFGPIGSPSISGSAPPGGAMSSPGMMSDIGQSFCAGNPSSGGGSGGVQMPSMISGGVSGGVQMPPMSSGGDVGRVPSPPGVKDPYVQLLESQSAMSMLMMQMAREMNQRSLQTPVPQQQQQQLPGGQDPNQAVGQQWGQQGVAKEMKMDEKWIPAMPVPGWKSWTSRGKELSGFKEWLEKFSGWLSLINDSYGPELWETIHADYPINPCRSPEQVMRSKRLFHILQQQFTGYSKIENLVRSQISATGITESNGFELLRLIRKEFSLMSRTEALSYREQCLKFRVKRNTEHLLDIIREVEAEIETTLWTRANPCLPTPEDDAFPLQVLTPPPSRELARMPEVVQIEATGLGGKNLGVDRPWDISIRTDPEGQNVYGPSLATVEDIVIEPDESGGMSTKHVTSLGISKAAHEFLTLHYFALDSAEWWEQILGELLPNAQFPAAVIRRTIAYQMFMAAHIAPSHRRPPHPVWEDSLSLIADLLFGSGVDRYVGAMQRADSPLEVNVRGFSAGSYSGLAFLHILWSIPRVTTKGCLGAIACPPALLSMSRAKRADRLHLIHYENDSLCSWKPGLQQIQGCCTSFTYITNDIASYKGHFGPDDHDYSHWMALELPHGSYALRVLLFIRPAAASKARRDATPLRLISWLSYKLNPELEQFIEKAMEHLSTWTETEGGKVLTMGKEAIPRGGTVDSEEELRNELIELISVGNLKYKPQALFTLFRQFLTRISLPRLIHFMGLVLPQLTPVQAAWAGEEKTLWSCHYIRWLRGRHSDATPRVQISYLFSSHDNIHHVRIQWNSNPLLLFTDPTMVEALPVEHFSQQASHMTHQQHLQMGLRKGMAILIYYVIGNMHYQAVLLAEESVVNRGKRGENRLWKRVTPTVTEFAWLPPNLAESFCKNALYRDDVRTYCAFDTPHLGLDTKNFVADVFVENILYLGDTRSADDLSVFTKMAPERLCLGCGLRVDEPFAPISTGERKKLFYAAQKLLTFVLHEVSAQTLSAEETALKIALRPLIINKAGHFVAAVTSMYQSLLEGKTDCPISGVFGAGKTLSAAAMIAGLLVMDPSLTIMIVTKENVAAHAFVKHFLRLGLPESINCLVGRLVGYVEMKKGPANQTALDIPPAFRNDVLRSKRVIVGCGGGFHQECQQPYSPVASWMEEADVALNDEGQQYGNLDEASAIARVPRKCLVVWCGDHKQTPGGLRKTDEAKAFRRKIPRRPIALRGDTKHFQPNMLGKVVLRYLDGMDEPLINRVQVILRATMGGRSVSSEEDIVTLQLLCQEVGCPYHEEPRSTACSVALVVLWMGLHQEKFPLLATTLQAAAGVSGPQKWALILPSSARVLLVTYTAVIAVRYPELDNVQNDLICFGNYLLGEQATSGGFLPLFWDAPSAYMHAATDIGSAVDWLQSQVELNSDENGCLAVLHNRNKMVATFGNSEWVTQSDGAVQSKSVTSCAGMTAHCVLLAQTFFFGSLLLGSSPGRSALQSA